MPKKLFTGGFTAIGAVVVALIIIVIATAGWYVWRTNHKQSAKTSNTIASSKQTNQSTTLSSANTIRISTADGKVSVALPNTWQVLKDANNPNGDQVISNNKSTQVCKGGICGVAGCLDVEDTVPCIYEAALQPKALTPPSNQTSWLLTVEKTSWTTPEAVQSLLGELNGQNTVDQNSKPINGYNSFYVKVKGGSCSGECYVDIHYFLEDNGYLVHFSNREQYTNNSSNPVQWNVAQYSPAFSGIVKSVKLNF